MVVIAVMTTETTHLSWQLLADDVHAYGVQFDIDLQFMKKADCKVSVFCPSPEFGGVQCGCDYANFG